jgi:HSP20 family protein
MNEKKNKEKKAEPVELQKREVETAPTPFGFIRQFAEDMEKLFGGFEGLRFPGLFSKGFPFRNELEGADWIPAIEVLRKNGELTVRAELPGLKKEDIKVELTGDFLTISGKRQEAKEEKREGYYHSERSYGSFFREIPLPEGAKTETATAKFTDGVLEVKLEVPKAVAPVRELKIKGAEETPKVHAAAK